MSGESPPDNIDHCVSVDISQMHTVDELDESDSEKPSSSDLENVLAQRFLTKTLGSPNTKTVSPKMSETKAAALHEEAPKLVEMEHKRIDRHQLLSQYSFKVSSATNLDKPWGDGSYYKVVKLNPKGDEFLSTKLPILSSVRRFDEALYPGTIDRDELRGIVEQDHNYSVLDKIEKRWAKNKKELARRQSPSEKSKASKSVPNDSMTKEIKPVVDASETQSRNMCRGIVVAIKKSSSGRTFTTETCHIVSKESTSSRTDCSSENKEKADFTNVAPDVLEVAAKLCSLDGSLTSPDYNTLHGDCPSGDTLEIGKMEDVLSTCPNDEIKSDPNAVVSEADEEDSHSCDGNKVDSGAISSEVESKLIADATEALMSFHRTVVPRRVDDKQCDYGDREDIRLLLDMASTSLSRSEPLKSTIESDTKTESEPMLYEQECKNNVEEPCNLSQVDPSNLLKSETPVIKDEPETKMNISEQELEREQTPKPDVPVHKSEPNVCVKPELEIVSTKQHVLEVSVPELQPQSERQTDSEVFISNQPPESEVFIAENQSESEVLIAENQSESEVLIAENQSESEVLIAENQSGSEVLIAENQAGSEVLIAENQSGSEVLIGENQSGSEVLIAENQSGSEVLIAENQSGSEVLIAENQSESEVLIAENQSQSEVLAENNLESEVLIGGSHPESEVLIVHQPESEVLIVEHQTESEVIISEHQHESEVIISEQHNSEAIISEHQTGSEVIISEQPESEVIISEHEPGCEVTISEQSEVIISENQSTSETLDFVSQPKSRSVISEAETSISENRPESEASISDNQPKLELVTAEVKAYTSEHQPESEAFISESEVSTSEPSNKSEIDTNFDIDTQSRLDARRDSTKEDPTFKPSPENSEQTSTSCDAEPSKNKEESDLLNESVIYDNQEVHLQHVTETVSSSTEPADNTVTSMSSFEHVDSTTFTPKAYLEMELQAPASKDSSILSDQVQEESTIQNEIKESLGDKSDILTIMEDVLKEEMEVALQKQFELYMRQVVSEAVSKLSDVPVCKPKSDSSPFLNSDSDSNFDTVAEKVTDSDFTKKTSSTKKGKVTSKQEKEKKKMKEKKKKYEPDPVFGAFDALVRFRIPKKKDVKSSSTKATKSTLPASSASKLRTDQVSSKPVPSAKNDSKTASESDKKQSGVKESIDSKHGESFKASTKQDQTQSEVLKRVASPITSAASDSWSRRDSDSSSVKLPLSESVKLMPPNENLMVWPSSAMVTQPSPTLSPRTQSQAARNTPSKPVSLVGNSIGTTGNFSGPSTPNTSKQLNLPGSIPLSNAKPPPPLGNFGNAVFPNATKAAGLSVSFGCPVGSAGNVPKSVAGLSVSFSSPVTGNALKQTGLSGNAGSIASNTISALYGSVTTSPSRSTLLTPGPSPTSPSILSEHQKLYDKSFYTGKLDLDMALKQKILTGVSYKGTFFKESAERIQQYVKATEGSYPRKELISVPIPPPPPPPPPLDESPTPPSDDICMRDNNSNESLSPKENSEKLTFENVSADETKLDTVTDKNDERGEITIETDLSPTLNENKHNCIGTPDNATDSPEVTVVDDANQSDIEETEEPREANSFLDEDLEDICSEILQESHKKSNRNLKYTNKYLKPDPPSPPPPPPEREEGEISSEDEACPPLPPEPVEEKPPLPPEPEPFDEYPYTLSELSAERDQIIKELMLEKEQGDEQVSASTGFSLEVAAKKENVERELVIGPKLKMLAKQFKIPLSSGKDIGKAIASIEKILRQFQSPKKVVKKSPQKKTKDTSKEMSISELFRKFESGDRVLDSSDRRIEPPEDPRKRDSNVSAVLPVPKFSVDHRSTSSRQFSTAPKRPDFPRYTETIRCDVGKKHSFESVSPSGDFRKGKRRRSQMSADDEYVVEKCARTDDNVLRGLPDDPVPNDEVYMRQFRNRSPPSNNDLTKRTSLSERLAAFHSRTKIITASAPHLPSRSRHPLPPPM